jgi:formylglycine-generating enzyme required for sulfatase activity
MVMLPEGYCIDSTEVTRAQYQAWLDTNPSTSGQGFDCDWNTSYAPDADCMNAAEVCSTGCDAHPQVCVDWCDAYAYCQAVGKRLCGKIGGGANAYDDVNDANLSQWFNACSSHGTRTYPYAKNAYDSTACNGADYPGPLTTVAVGTITTCQSDVPGYSGVYDLVGNVREWEDSCDGAGESAPCRERGGSHLTTGVFLNCGDATTDVRSTTCQDGGFRCCSP